MPSFGRFVGAMAVLGILAFPKPAEAASIELALVLDASSSITPADWGLQVNGHASAVLAAVPTDGSVAISVIEFATTAAVVRPLTTINNASDLNALATFFSSLAQTTGDTCISCALVSAEGTFTGLAQRSVIDVSTDGEWTVGVNPAGPAATAGTSQWAVANDADVVNVIGIGPSAVVNWNFGPGSFNLTSATFNDFQVTLTTKLRREIAAVPEPATLLLLGSGLAVAVRRLRQ